MCETHTHKNFTVSEKAISLQEIEVWDGRDVMKNTSRQIILVLECQCCRLCGCVASTVRFWQISISILLLLLL